ncbi:alpha-1,2-mannosyltransferase (Kre5), partial [Varicellaria rhodocarpa]|nr:alpha-1,2-mannosyltransferase (Kre5) [Varicellaria rhodocarpa]
MGLVQNIAKRIPSSPNLSSLEKLPSLGDLSRQRERITPRLAFFRRRIRLKGNSKISVPLGTVLLFPCIIIIVILILIARHPTNPVGRLLPAGAPPSIRRISDKHDKVFVPGCLEPQTNGPRANAVFVVLARDQELEGVIQSVKSIERHFNRWFHYPYVFLNDGDFGTHFKDSITNYTSAPVEFGKIDASMWGYPEWVNSDVAREGIRKQGDAAIMYGGFSTNMNCSKNMSGTGDWNRKSNIFVILPSKQRTSRCMEPTKRTSDPFQHMIRANKTYGFTIAVKELKETVPNIFRYAAAYKRKNNIQSQGLWEMFLEQREEEPKSLPKDDPKYQTPLPEEILSTEPGHGKLPDIDPEAMEGETYNMCHFWSNFEIARLDWFRSKEYNEFFEMMDRSGGFWMERWGDAPIHSLAAGALLSPKDIHYFRDFGYRHTTIQHCPANAPARQLPRQPFLEKTTEDERKRKEEDEYWETWDAEKENGVGCRCKCDTDIVDVE